jgi:hypothetical protein
MDLLIKESEFTQNEVLKESEIPMDSTEIFKIYCKLFINKNINLNETRIFINKHNFDGRNSKCNKELAENLIKNFLNDKISCSNTIIEGFDYNNINNLNSNEIKKILDNIIDNKYGYKKNFVSFEYKLNNEIFNKYINNVNENNLNDYNKIFNNNLINSQKTVFIKHLQEAFKFNCLLGSYLKNYCDIICSNLHIKNISKKTFNRYVEKNKFVCESCKTIENKIDIVENIIENKIDIVENKIDDIGAFIINKNTVKYNNIEYKIKESILTEYKNRGYKIYPNNNIINVNDILPYKCKCNYFYDKRKIKNVFASNECNKCRKNKIIKSTENELNDIQIIINDSETQEDSSEIFINEINNLHNQFIKNIETITKKYSLEIKKIINNYKQ